MLGNLNKGSTFAPALRYRRNKKKDNVRRHIELTAVSFNNETKEIRALESRDYNKTERKHRINNIKIYDEEFDPGSG